MFNPNPLPRFPRRRSDCDNNGNTRRSGTLAQTARDYIFNQNPIGLFFMGFSLLGLLVQGMPYILASIYTILACLSVTIWAFYDVILGTALVGEFPPLMGMVWGAVLGACCAFWLSAPLYGWRKKRAYIILVPLALMVVSGVVVSRTRPMPAQPDLLANVRNTAISNNTTATPMPATVLPASPVGIAPR